MDNRLLLDDLLKTVCDNVYFQPPNNIKIKYPAIIYQRSEIKADYASNFVYNTKTLYSVTVIDKNPDSDIVKNVSNMLTSKHDRHFVSDNLNHDTFTIFY